MYLPSMTDSELSRYAYQYAQTDLERELTKRFLIKMDEEIAEIASLKKEIESLESKNSEYSEDIDSLTEEVQDLRTQLADAAEATV